MTDIVERARLVQRVNAHWLDSICDCDECTEERFDLITPMADEIERLRARVKECEKVMQHYGMETEHSCMCQFVNDTDTLASECHYHEQVRLRAEQAEARLAKAEDAIERAGRCLAMSNKGAAEALAILMVYKQADSASVEGEKC